MYQSFMIAILIFLTSPMICCAQEGNLRSEYERSKAEAGYAISAGNYEREEITNFDPLNKEMSEISQRAINSPYPNANPISIHESGAFDPSWVFVIFAAALSLAMASLLAKSKK